VYLVIETLSAKSGATEETGSLLYSDVITNVTTPAPCSVSSPCPTVFADTASATIRAELKNVGSPTSPTPTTNNDVTINRIHIDYRRADGRNTPGVDVPYPWDAAATITIPGGGSGTIGFEVVRHVAKQESPLVQLIASSTIINTIAEITFYGRDQVGNDVLATANLQIDFGNFGDK
jgi:hypothetical protein